MNILVAVFCAVMQYNEYFTWHVLPVLWILDIVQIRGIIGELSYIMAFFRGLFVS
jgi:hypothetical protein